MIRSNHPGSLGIFPIFADGNSDLEPQDRSFASHDRAMLQRAHIPIPRSEQISHALRRMNRTGSA